MNMRSSHNPEFAIDLSDLDAVIELLSDRQLVAVDDLNVRDLIISDLEKLPSTDIGPFSISFLNRQGGGSEWVSIEVGDEGMEFSVGNHCHSPEVGGDTCSETIFKCWEGGGSEGHLSDWLSHLNLLDRDLMKISISHELAGYSHRTEPPIIEDEGTHGTPLSPSNPIVLESRRDRLIFALRKAADDPRLSSDLQQRAKMNLGRLLAIARARPHDR